MASPGAGRPTSTAPPARTDALLARLALAALAAAAACVQPPVPLVVETPVPASATVDRAARPYAAVLDNVRAALEIELGVVVPPFRLVLHPDEGSFARGLQSTGADPAFARATARTMDGIGGPGWVQVHRPMLEALNWRERTAMLVHEVVHVLQYAWAGGRRGTSEQWLREGFAEWVTERALIRLGHHDEREARARLAAMPRRLASLPRPPLGQLRTFPEWLRWVDSRRDAEPYALAAVAADRLIQLHGVSAVIGYFRQFETGQDRDRAFQQAFGRSVDEFDDDLRRWMALDRRRP